MGRAIIQTKIREARIQSSVLAEGTAGGEGLTVVKSKAGAVGPAADVPRSICGPFICGPPVWWSASLAGEPIGVGSGEGIQLTCHE